MSIAETGKLVMKTATWYDRHALGGWSDLIALSKIEMNSARELPSPDSLPWLHKTIYRGAHIAIREERIINCNLWEGYTRRAFALAAYYGVVLNIAERSTDIENFKIRLNPFLQIGFPISSPQAIIEAARDMEIKLPLSDDELRACIRQRLPRLAAQKLSGTPPTPSA